MDDLEDMLSKDLGSATIAAAHADKPKGISESTLAKLLNIREDLAKDAIDSTIDTQLNRQSAENTLSWKISTNDRMLLYRRINSTFFTDTMFATTKVYSRKHMLSSVCE